MLKFIKKITHFINTTFTSMYRSRMVVFIVTTAKHHVVEEGITYLLPYASMLLTPIGIFASAILFIAIWMLCKSGLL